MRYKVDSFGGCFLVSFPIKPTSHSSNITALNRDNIIVVTEGDDDIDHSEISYAVSNFVVYVCVY